MKGRDFWAYVAAVCLFATSWLGAQTNAAPSSGPEGAVGPAASSGSVVPRLIQFSGVVKDGTSKLVTGGITLTFSLYEFPEGGTPLWSETQSVQADGEGRYTVLLGASSSAGLPLDLFTSGAARWLGVQPQLPGVGEQPRVLLVGVPYALKAADADTLGGKPASAYVTTTSESISAGNSRSQTSESVKASPAAQSPNITGSGSPGFVPLWTTTTNLGNSRLFQSGSSVGIGTKTPAATLDVNGTANFSGAVTFVTPVTFASGQTFPGVDSVVGVDGSPVNPMQVALLKWYAANQASVAFAVGSFPEGVAFDGANIWVANSADNNATKLRASDGATLGTFAVGMFPFGVAFDGANVWVTNDSSNTVTKLRASNGTTLGTFAVGTNPIGVAFDGANIWVANDGSSNVTKLRASDGTILGTFAVGDGPFGVAFDGANVWVANQGSASVSKLRASDGTILGTFAVGSLPHGVAFDGANIWVANQLSNNVTKLRASDGAILGIFAVGTSPSGVAFDGANVWVANQGSASVSKLRASDGTNLGTFAVGSTPIGVAFDGANIWVANDESNSVSKL